MKKRYCEMCGGLIDSDSKKCTSCGKQYFKVPKRMGQLLLVVLCLIFAGLNIFQYVHFTGSKDIVEETISVNDYETVDYSVWARMIAINSKVKAYAIFSEWLSGEATEESMMEIMNRYGANQGGSQLYKVERGIFVDEVVDWCFDDKRREGDCEIIHSPLYGYIICCYSKDTKPSGQSNENAKVLLQKSNFPEETKGKTFKEILEEFDAQKSCENMINSAIKQN